MEGFILIYGIGMILIIISVGAYISDKIPEEWFQR